MSPRQRAPQTSPAVEEFLKTLKHPLKDELNAVRRMVLSVSPAITEDVKWNAPSFRVDDFFATINVRAKVLQLVFHRGAKSKTNEVKMELPDPLGMVEWRGTDRCLVTLGDGTDLAAKEKAFKAIVRAWVKQL